MNIPKQYKVGGVDIDVEFVERLGGGQLGACILASGKVKIAEKFMYDGKLYEISDANKESTFYHELTRSILDTMAEVELSGNEKFVSTFSSLLTEAMKSAGVVYNNHDEHRHND